MGVGGKGTRAGSAGFRTGLPSGGRGNDCRWLPYPARAEGEGTAHRGKQDHSAPSLEVESEPGTTVVTRMGGWAYL